MARYCIVAPTQILSALDAVGELGSYHLLLAHDVAKRPHDYSQLFKQKGYDRRELFYTDRLVILDNSVVELGTAVSHDMIWKAVDTVTPTCIVLPDVPLNARLTIEAGQNAYPIWEALRPEFISFMVIPQGTTIHEFSACAEAFADSSKYTYICWWGIPRNLVAQVGTRRDAIEIVRALNPHRRIHLFGFSDDLIDDLICARNRFVYSIDSAVPIRAPFKLSLNSELSPRGNWWEEGELTPYCVGNIQYVRDIFWNNYA
jgi:hypothetical protein